MAAKDDHISNAYLEAPEIKTTADAAAFPFHFLSTIEMSMRFPHLKSLPLPTNGCVLGEQCFPKERMGILAPHSCPIPSVLKYM